MKTSSTVGALLWLTAILVAAFVVATLLHERRETAGGRVIEAEITEGPPMKMKMGLADVHAEPVYQERLDFNPAERDWLSLGYGAGDLVYCRKEIYGADWWLVAKKGTGAVGSPCWELGVGPVTAATPPPPPPPPPPVIVVEEVPYTPGPSVGPVQPSVIRRWNLGLTFERDDSSRAEEVQVWIAVNGQPSSLAASRQVQAGESTITVPVTIQGRTWRSMTAEARGESQWRWRGDTLQWLGNQ